MEELVDYISGLSVYPKGPMRCRCIEDPEAFPDALIHFYPTTDGRFVIAWEDRRRGKLYMKETLGLGGKVSFADQEGRRVVCDRRFSVTKREALQVVQEVVEDQKVKLHEWVCLGDMPWLGEVPDWCSLGIGILNMVRFPECFDIEDWSELPELLVELRWMGESTRKESWPTVEFVPSGYDDVAELASVDAFEEVVYGKDYLESLECLEMVAKEDGLSATFGELWRAYRDDRSKKVRAEHLQARYKSAWELMLIVPRRSLVLDEAILWSALDKLVDGGSILTLQEAVRNEVKGPAYFDYHKDRYQQTGVRDLTARGNRLAKIVEVMSGIKDEATTTGILKCLEIGESIGLDDIRFRGIVDSVLTVKRR